MSFRRPRARAAVQRDPARARVAALVPEDARRILHIGCGRGLAGLLLKLRAPGRHVTGVVADPELAREAAGHCDEVLSPEGAAQLPPSSFDCILTGSLLDGAADPAAALRSALRFLEPGGHLVVEAPSAACAVADAAAAGAPAPRAGLTRRHLLALLRGTGCEPTSLRLDLEHSVPERPLPLASAPRLRVEQYEESLAPRLFATALFAAKPARPPRCSVVVRPAGDTAATVAAIRGTRGGRLPIVVANGATARDLNEAARRARGRWIAFVDGDSIPEQGWLGGLVAAADSGADVGAAASIVVGADGAIVEAGLGIDSTSLPYRHLPFPLRAEHAGDAAAAGIDGLLVERETFLLLGGFDERFGDDLFDVDFCLRLRAHGRRIVVSSSSVLRSGGTGAASRDVAAALSATAPDASGFRDEARGHAYFGEKWSPPLEASMLAAPVERVPPGIDRAARAGGPATLLWSGHVFGAGGYAESTRGFLDCLDRAGVRTLVHAFSTNTPASFDEAVQYDRFVCDRAPECFVSIVSRPAIFFRRQPCERIAIGRTMNETDRIPPRWVERCNQMDEVWVPSRFNYEAFERSGVDRERLFVVPETIDERLYGPSVEPLAIENATGFVFLSVFLLGPRKGWKTLLAAYFDEFGAHEDVTLLLRVSPAVHSPLSQLTDFLAERLGGDVSRGPRVVLCPASVEGRLMPRLYRSVDAFVLPSRGEGWGRPYMEAMASGLPTIGTGWSGNTEFMDPDNSYLLDYRLVPHNDPSLPPHFHTPEHTLWAEPSERHLRTLMRTVFENRGEAAARGARARESVLDRFRHEKVARLIVDRLEHAGLEVARQNPRKTGSDPISPDFPPLCSVVVLTQDGTHDRAPLHALLAALEAAAPAFPWEVVVVNGDAIRLPPCPFPVRTVEAPGAGGSAARNAGTLAARGELVVFIGEGTTPGAGWLDRLVAAFRERSQTGLVGSRILAADRSLLSAGIVFGPDLLPYARLRGAREAGGAQESRAFAASARPRAMRAVSSTGMLVPRATLLALGGFDENLAGLHADAELCLRVREHGLDVLYCPASTLVHEDHAAPGPRDEREQDLRFLERAAPGLVSDDEALCDEDGIDVFSARAAAWPMPPRGSDKPSRTPAVLWSAPLFDRSGYANEARDYVLALDAAGVDVYANPYPFRHAAPDLPASDHARLAAMAAARLPQRFVHVVQHQAIRFARHPHAVFQIGRTMFETDGLPADRVELCNAMDEIWVPSRFNAETFARAGVDAHRLVVVPEAIDADLYRGRARPLAIPDARGFVFLSAFAWSLRKGWDVLLRAYVEEFSAAEDVTLVLAVNTSATGASPDPAPAVLSYLRGTLQRDPAAAARIVVVPLDLSPRRMPALYAAADAFVLPSRGEGWGRPLMEAMACGLPTVGTGWSGNTEFMHDGNSFLVASRLVDLPDDGWARHGMFRGQKWAAPSVEHLRARMREVFADRDGARAVGRRARREVLALYDRRRIAATMKARLEAAWR